MKTVLILATVAALSATAATAAPHGGSAFIHDYDTNKDGSVSRAEFDAERAVRYKATDANKDGTVSEEEYVGEYSARLEKELAASTDSEDRKTEERQRQIRQAHVRFGVLDTNKDNKIQQSEYDASGARAFAQQDDDKNGTVTQADATATAAKQLAARENRDQK
ncbi:hypothetical protein LWE61_08810 [Sphingobium sufflavum]|jgi:hypothetical protein|uniref:hypothetical protein n=1 Tax=Sphingobium sufflavum TaxID=1129547 RepID=UPI001F1A2FA6|nr:hypothetical protein [Sphingobium sufflavum]MCE7796659.1 hypothetical protein [Sphingobium sufflavum]